MDNKDKTAFPYVSDGSHIEKFSNKGMTMFEYYAAHAPAEVPEWFEDRLRGENAHKVNTTKAMINNILEEEGIVGHVLVDELLDKWLDPKYHISLSGSYDAGDQRQYGWGKDSGVHKALVRIEKEYWDSTGKKQVPAEDYSAEESYFQWRAYYAEQMCKLSN